MAPIGTAVPASHGLNRHDRVLANDRRAIIDVTTAIIGIVTLGLLIKVKKVPEPRLILAAAAVGLVLRGGSP